MFRRVHDQLGTAGLIVACIALVFALGGGAYAASKGLTSKQKKEVKSISKTEAQKYANSNPGAPGATGPAGPAGADGKAGADGTNGTNGTNGAPGKSVQVIDGAAGCEEDGVTVQVVGEPATAKEICNGLEGPQGPIGHFSSSITLPAGETLTGVWSGTEDTAAPVPAFVAAISFQLPLAAPLDASHVHVSTGSEVSGPCTGNAPSPTAAAGHLCVYKTTAMENGEIYPLTGIGGDQGASKIGALLRGNAFFLDHVAAGSWAVTAATP